ncbi:unnamed protein product, partial [Discosporangium mesarthrocarpum]
PVSFSKDPGRFARAKKAVKRVRKDLDLGAGHLRTVLNDHLGQDFTQVLSLRRMQMRLKVFLRKGHHHQQGEITAENTGIAKVVANKGGLVCKLRLLGTTMCFVSCHLQAHEGKNNLERRNSSCAEILQGARLGDRRQVDLDCQFHHVFWFGDMNYRIDFGLPFAKQCSKVKELIKAKDWSSLWEGDELLRELKKQRLLTGFKTEPPLFPPTFKTIRGTNGDHYNPKRIPSYTDRVLWKSMPGHARNLRLTGYRSFPEISSSDHKPIHAAFDVYLSPEAVLASLPPEVSPQPRPWRQVVTPPRQSFSPHRRLPGALVPGLAPGPQGMGAALSDIGRASDFSGPETPSDNGMGLGLGG